jgi:hypothetical protein
LVALAVALSAGRARAQDLPGGTLRVTRSESAADCPDEGTLRAATLALGSPPAPPTGEVEPLLVEVDFQRTTTGYSAWIQTRGRKEGTRELHKDTASCAALAEAVSVVLAVVFDLLPEPAPQEAASPAQPPAQLAAPKAPPVEKSPPKAPTESRSPPPQETKRELRLAVGIEAAAGYGLLGDALVGALAASFRGQLEHWEVSLGGLWAPDRTVSYLERSVHLSLLSARLGACGWLKPRRSGPDAGLCTGLYLGSVRGRGDGFDPDETAAEAWFAFEAGVAGRVPLTDKLALRLGISAVIPFRQQTFSVTGAGVAFASSDAALLLAFGPELGFL